ncbi:helix-turn-helix transcriptional regulator [Streptomyces orinoci]|uniref:Transcriptional regulator n=1 Tax=Streptomyces orinoci TaxID=67339 RepID=A0ABV3K0K0_STRON|nr:transcriptional regulator [Streptomyces orinoci]
MRADRLLSLLLLLQNRGRLTAPELARELEVSVRTVYRDIEALSASGVPVLADRGPSGGYRLLDGYRTRLTGLTGDEAGSLLLAALPQAAAELGLGAELAAAQLKLQAALPDGPGEHARRVRERFHLDAPAWFRAGDPVPHLGTIAEAVWRQRRLWLRYRSWSGEARRTADPLGLVLKGGIWYLVATGERGIRTYRVGRVLACETAEETFERPADFDLAAAWRESARAMEAGRIRGEARLRLSPRGLRLLPAKFGALGERAVDGAGPADAEGWVTVTLAVESLEVAVHDLLGLGLEAEVLGPDDLRAALGELIRRLAARYPDGGSTPVHLTADP